MTVTIYHNPQCGTSRNVLALLKERGHTPAVIEYLKTPLSKDALAALVAEMGVPVRDLVRAKEALFAELGLADATDDALLDAMAAHPILMNRPVVRTEKGVKLCRPSETVAELL